MSHEHTHSHGHHHGGTDLTSRRLILCMLLNLMITVAEIVGGLLSGSLSLLSDSLHNLSDSLSMLVSWWARRVAQRPNSTQKTFGYKRAEILAALLNTASLLAISVFLIREAISRFFQPQPINGTLMFAVACVGLFGNLISALLLARGAKESLNIRSTYLHILVDALSSVAVIIAGLLVITMKWYVLDPILTVALAIYVLRSGWTMLGETVHILMQGTPQNIAIDQLVQDLEALEGVAGIHHVHLWALTETELHFESHVQVQTADLSEWEETKRRIKEHLHDHYHVEHSTLELECECCSSPGLICPS